ncbi:MAG: 50S ribosomal protein L15 [Termitinemataceae bacterium]|nr:MAG: 50S ribosomal protein L15 [Termitinemataceae bacterium]
MQNFDLHAPEGANKRKRIVGRGQGSGRGTTAGKGNKGQQSRSGGKTYLGFEGGQMPLYRRLAHRGFSNYPFKKIYQVVNVDELNAKYSEGEVVDQASLLLKGILKRGDLVKILGDGELSKKLDVRIEAVSATARDKIAKAGGTVAEFEQKVDPRKQKGVKRSKKTTDKGKVNG